MKAGPTGEFPDGKISPDDEGQLRIVLSQQSNGDIRFNFGTDLSWFQLPPKDAVRLAMRLMALAKRSGP